MSVHYKQPGKMVDHRPQSDVAAGSIVVLGKKIAVSAIPIPAGTLGSLSCEGVFEAPVNTSGSYAFGDALHWDGAKFAAAGTNGTHAFFWFGSAADLAGGRGDVKLV